MPKIDFYILSEGNTAACLQLACRLTEKAYKNQHRIYINAENQSQAHLLDELLWTYQEDSFLPHNLYGEGPEPAPPIQIGFGVTPDNHRDILINLSSETPAFVNRFNRVLELIPNDDTLQALARDRFRNYRQQGLDINTHKLKSFDNSLS